MNICSQRTHDIIKLSLSFVFRKVSQIKLNGVGHVSRKVWLKSNTRRQFANQCKNIFICLNRCALQIRESPGTKKKNTKNTSIFFCFRILVLQKTAQAPGKALAPSWHAVFIIEIKASKKKLQIQNTLYRNFK